MSSACPYANAVRSAGDCRAKKEEFVEAEHKGNDDNSYGKVDNPGVIQPKCPLGYDSTTFKLGPLSCIICQALLYQSSKCLPCSHKFCKQCISHFNDCPLCGADIETVDPDPDLQATVDQFIDGHARIKRHQPSRDNKVTNNIEKVIYEDVSMERGAFLVQQAMRAFRAHNFESAKSRLSICLEDIRDQLQTSGENIELCSQLGAVLGMLGDCCRSMGEPAFAISYYEESVEFLSKLQPKDFEFVHTLSVSLNKIGDLRYYGGDLQSARSCYVRALEVRRNTTKEHPTAVSQVIDLATSIAKVADIDRNLGNEKLAVEGFKEAIECLEALKLGSDQAALDQRRRTVLDFLHAQVAENKQSQ